MSVAVAPTATFVSLDARKKKMAFQFLIQTMVLLRTVSSETTRYAFIFVPFHRRASPKTTVRTTESLDGWQSSFANSIPIDGNGLGMSSTSVDQEYTENYRDISFNCTETCTKPVIALPKNNINRVEMWYLDQLEEYYAYSERHLKCPFFRRRSADILDNVESFVRFFLIRPYLNDSSSYLGPPMSCRSSPGWKQKTKHLSVDQLLNTLRNDWRAIKNDRHVNNSETETARVVNEKGYYVTGKISTQIYRNDCEFLSPDPDMPLKGLRKYIGVASHLFDSKASRSKLLSLEELRRDDDESYKNHGVEDCIVLKAEWKLSLTINLPWKPQLSEFSGSTLYFLDEDNLICRHEEVWDISVLDAFLGMLSIPKNRKKKDSNFNKNSRCPLSLFLPQNPQYSSKSKLSSHSPEKDSRERRQSFR